MQKRKLLVLAILLSLAQLSIAQAISADTVLNLIKTGMAPAVSKLTSTAISWLGVFAVIQFVITNYGLLKNDGDLQAVIAKATAALTWVGVCLYIINNGPDFIQAVGDEMMGIVGFDLPSASGVVSQTVKISGVVAAVAEVAFCCVGGYGFEVHADWRGCCCCGGGLWRGSGVVVVVYIFGVVCRYYWWLWHGI